MINPVYSPASDRYSNGIRFRRCGRSGVLLPEISLGFWHNFGDVNPLTNSFEMAAGRGQTLAGMALAWCLKDDKVTSVIIGASSVGQIKDNLKAMENTSFSAEELKKIDDLTRMAGY